MTIIQTHFLTIRNFISMLNIYINKAGLSFFLKTQADFFTFFCQSQENCDKFSKYQISWWEHQS